MYYRQDSVPPPLGDPKEFEAFCCDAFSVHWARTVVLPYGRLGQRQHGINLTGTDSAGRRIAIQCKCITHDFNRSAVIPRIREDIEAAFSARTSKVRAFNFEHFYVAISVDRDARITDEVLRYCAERGLESQVDIVFWPDLWSWIKADASRFLPYFPMLASGPYKDTEMATFVRSAVNLDNLRTDLAGWGAKLRTHDTALSFTRLQALASAPWFGFCDDSLHESFQTFMSTFTQREVLWSQIAHRVSNNGLGEVFSAKGAQDDAMFDALEVQSYALAKCAKDLSKKLKLYAQARN